MSENEKRQPKLLYGGWAQATYDRLKEGLGGAACANRDDCDDVAHTLRHDAEDFDGMVESHGPKWPAKAQLWRAVADAIDCFAARMRAIEEKS